MQRNSHAACKEWGRVATRHPTRESSPSMCSWATPCTDFFTEDAEKGEGAMGEKGKWSIKRQPRVSLFGFEKYNSKLKHKWQPLKQEESRPPPSPCKGCFDRPMNENVKPLTLICWSCHPLSGPPLAWLVASNRSLNWVHSREQERELGGGNSTTPEQGGKQLVPSR